MYEETFGIRREENSVFVTLRPIILFLKKKKKLYLVILKNQIIVAVLSEPHGSLPGA